MYVPYCIFTHMSRFLRRFSKNLVFENYIQAKVGNVNRSMKLHVDNFEGFADKLRSLVKGVDVEAFKTKTIEEVYRLIWRHDQKMETLMFVAYVKATQMESPAADLFVDIIKTDRPALEVLSGYLLADSWPRSFYGMNMLTHVSRTDKIFTNAIVSPLNVIDRKNILPSNKVSSPVTSLFLVLQQFAWATRDSHLYRI